MTFPLGFEPAKLAAMEAQMRSSYRMRVLVDLLDFDHNHLLDLRSSRISGSVQVKADSGGVTRSLSMDLFDPTDMLGLGDGTEPRTPNRMIQVKRGIYLDDYSEWVDVPVIMGPLSQPSRTGDVLTITAQDKAALSIDPRPSFTLKAGTNIATGIEHMMRTVVGESRFRLATTTRKLQNDQTISPDQAPWALVQKMCRSIGWVGFYDGDGYLVCRPQSTVPVAEFRKGPGGSLTSEATAGYWDGDLVNRATVVGAVIGKTTVTATVTANEADLLSPESMAFGGVPWVKTEIVNDSDVSSYADAVALAKSTLTQRLVQQTTGTFEALPFWHLQEYDPYTLQTGAGKVTAALTETTIPLDSAGMQSFGRLSRTPPSRRKVRVRPRSSKLAAAERRKAGAKK
jgi:hypothetical protein